MENILAFEGDDQPKTAGIEAPRAETDSLLRIFADRAIALTALGFHFQLSPAYFANLRGGWSPPPLPIHFSEPLHDSHNNHPGFGEIAPVIPALFPEKWSAFQEKVSHN
jgi:hypothetical protein